MIVVSDTTAITTLLKAGEAHFLQKMFGEIAVPQAVWDELLAFHSKLPDFVSLRSLASVGQHIPDRQALGRGELEAIQLAQQIHADLFLTDDRKARMVAEEMGISCVGLAGLVVRARQTGQISSARDFIEMLEKRGGLYLSEAVKSATLRLAGELF